jgi:hypothetical protein
LLSSATQAAFVKVCPVILTQDLKGRPQLDSSMSLTFSLNLLKGLDTSKQQRPDLKWSALPFRNQSYQDARRSIQTMEAWKSARASQASSLFISLRAVATRD